MPPNAVPIVPVGLSSAATMLFRENGLLHVAAIVKATFVLSHQASMRITQPEPVFTREAHRLNNPTRSIVATSDLVPRLPAADVLLLGQAYAPGGSAAHARVRLAIGRGNEVLLDKTIGVVGDRKGHEIKPFRSMPLVYEKAFGGPGFRDNPLGTGVLTGDPLPNLVDPSAPGENRAVGFAPISRSWPARTSLAPAEVRSALDRPIAEIPQGFDLRYFHAAPPDQRLAHLLGDEWIVLEGVHPDLPRIEAQLPNAQAMVKIVGTEADGRVFSLRPDTLRIDADAGRCTIVWRNSLRLRESDLGAMQLFGGVALPDLPITWPESAALPQAGPSTGGARAITVNAAGGTIILEDSNTVAANPGGTMEVADEDIESVHIEVSVDDFDATAVFGRTAVPATTALPPVQVHVAAPRAIEGTMDFSDSTVAAGQDRTPFVLRPPAPRAEARQPSGGLVGLPFQPARNEMSVTFDASILDDPEASDAAIDLAGTMMSFGEEAPAARESSPRVHIAEVETRAPVEAKAPAIPEKSSLFSHDSPDSAPTQILPLPPRAAALRPKPAWYNEPPAPSPAEGAAPARESAPQAAADEGAPGSEEAPPTVIKPREPKGDPRDLPPGRFRK